MENPFQMINRVIKRQSYRIRSIVELFFFFYSFAAVNWFAITHETWYTYNANKVRGGKRKRKTKNHKTNWQRNRMLGTNQSPSKFDWPLHLSWMTWLIAQIYISKLIMNEKTQKYYFLWFFRERFNWLTPFWLLFLCESFLCVLVYMNDEILVSGDAGTTSKGDASLSNILFVFVFLETI